MEKLKGSKKLSRIRPKDYDKEIRELTSKGYKDSWIAKMIPLTRVQIYEYKRRNNIKCEVTEEVELESNSNEELIKYLKAKIRKMEIKLAKLNIVANPYRKDIERLENYIIENHHKWSRKKLDEVSQRLTDVVIEFDPIDKDCRRLEKQLGKRRKRLKKELGKNGNEKK